MKNDIYIEDYTEKSFVLLGDTRKYKDDIKTLGGKFNQNLRNNKVGWIFPMNKKNDVEDYIQNDNIKYNNNSTGKQDDLQQVLLSNQKILLSNQKLILQKLEKIEQLLNNTDSEDEDEDEDERPRIRLLKT